MQQAHSACLTGVALTIGLGFFNDFFFFIIFLLENYLFTAIEPSANKLASAKYIIDIYQSGELTDL